MFLFYNNILDPQFLNVIYCISMYVIAVIVLCIIRIKKFKNAISQIEPELILYNICELIELN